RYWLVPDQVDERRRPHRAPGLLWRRCLLGPPSHAHDARVTVSPTAQWTEIQNRRRERRVVGTLHHAVIAFYPFRCVVPHSPETRLVGNAAIFGYVSAQICPK